MRAKWRPFYGAVVGFYCLPLLVLLREGFFSAVRGVDFKHWVVIALFVGLLGGGMGWMICVLKNGWRSGR